MDIFNGARRIAILGAAVLAIGGAAGVYETKPDVVLHYKIPEFGSSGIRATDCNYGVDARSSESYEGRDGKKFSIEFCFAASRATNGKMLIPYKAVGDYTMMNTPYSAEVRSYIDGFKAVMFAPSRADYQEAEEAYTKQLWAKRAKMIGGIALSLAAYWACICAIGWAARGFVSKSKKIPATPEQVASSES